MEHWVWKVDCMKRISTHVESGDSLSEEILKGSAINERIKRAIKTAIPTDLTLLKKLLFLFFINNYIRNCVIFFIT